MNLGDNLKMSDEDRGNINKSSVHIKKLDESDNTIRISHSHVDDKYDEKKSQLLDASDSLSTKANELKEHRDRMYIAQRMRIVFRATREEGCLNSMMKLISVPLTLLRDYSVPIGDEDTWDRQRASVVPMTLVFAFLWLNGYMNSPDESEFANKFFLIGLICAVPGAIVGLIIKMKTKVTEAPSKLLTVYAIICFVMAIMWIQFTSNTIMDLLQLFGFIT